MCPNNHLNNETHLAHLEKGNSSWPKIIWDVQCDFCCNFPFLSYLTLSRVSVFFVCQVFCLLFLWFNMCLVNLLQDIAIFFPKELLSVGAWAKKTPIRPVLGKESCLMTSTCRVWMWNGWWTCRPKVWKNGCFRVHEKKRTCLLDMFLQKRYWPSAFVLLNIWSP